MKTDTKSLQALIALAENPSCDQRQILLDNIISLFVSKHNALSQAQSDLIGEIICLLLLSCPTDIRERVARELAPVRETPRQVVLQLAHGEYQVARHLLEISEALDENDLILIAENSSQEHLRSIARRPKLDLRIQIVILQKGDQSAVDELTRSLKSDTNTTKILNLRANNGFNFSHSELPKEKSA